MATRDSIPKEEPVALHDRAMDNLEYIRGAMARSAEFTAVSGKGGIAMGLVGLMTAWQAGGRSTPQAWVAVWFVGAGAAIAIAITAMAFKARAADEPLWSAAGRKFALSVSPPLVVGALLTPALLSAGQAELLPSVWLLLYGAGVLAGGSFSIPVIPVMGLCFLATGAVALYAPAEFGNLFMAAGFGGLNILFGVIIAWRHGG